MSMTDCPRCHGDGNVYAGKEWKTGIAGSYEVPAYKECPACNGTGEIVSTEFENDHATRIAQLEKTVAELQALLEHHGIR